MKDTKKPEVVHVIVKKRPVGLIVSMSIIFNLIGTFLSFIVLVPYFYTKLTIALVLGTIASTIIFVFLNVLLVSIWINSYVDCVEHKIKR